MKADYSKPGQLCVVEDATLQITPGDGWFARFTDGRVEPVICWRLARVTWQWGERHEGDFEGTHAFFLKGKTQVTTEILAVTRETLRLSRDPSFRFPDIGKPTNLINVEDIEGFVGYVRSSDALGEGGEGPS